MTPNLPLKGTNDIHAHEVLIKNVIDTQTGLLIPYSDAIGTDLCAATRTRDTLSRSIIAGCGSRYICPLCHQHLKLNRALRGARFYFAHAIPDTECDAELNEASSNSRINRARIYDGAKESFKHKEMKGLMLQTLDADPMFSEIFTEKRIRSKTSHLYRRPDIQATYTTKESKIKLAFEIQVSSEYVLYIAERKVFYSREGIPLIWILPEDNFNRATATVDDLYYCNNRNIFIIDRETLFLSQTHKQAIIKCAYDVPSTANGKLTLRRTIKHIKFKDLTHNTKEYISYYFDFNSHLRICEKEKFVHDFEKFWISQDVTFEEKKLKLIALSHEFSKYGILGLNKSNNTNTIHFLNHIYTAKHGTTIGPLSDYPCKVIADRVLSHYKSHICAFMHAISIYGKKDNFTSHRNWRVIEERYRNEDRPRIKSYDTRYILPTNFNPLIHLLFPDLAKVLYRKS